MAEPMIDWLSMV